MVYMITYEANMRYDYAPIHTRKVNGNTMKIARISAYQVDLPLKEGSYNHLDAFQTAIARETA